MPEIQAPNIFGGFLAGRQARQAEEQQALQNQFAQQRMQMQQAEFQAQQDALARDQQFNQLVGDYLGQDTVEALGGVPMGGQGAPPPQPRVSINQLYALDPQRAMQLQAFQAQQAEMQRQQEIEQAKQVVTRAQYALQSEAPATLLRIGFPEFAEQLREQGVDVDNLDDDTVRGYAQTLIEHFGPIAGIGPAAEGGEDFTLSEGQTRFDSRGRPIASVAKGPSAEDENRAFQNANVLRDEFTSLTKDFQTVAGAYNLIKAVAEKPSAAGDISLLSSYMRMVDPGSTVREGEFATAQNAGGVPQRVVSFYNNLLRGERLSDEQRKDFVAQARNMFKSRAQQAKATRKKYTTLAKRAKLDPIDVVGEEDDFEITETAPGGAPTDLSGLSDEDLLKALAGG